MITIVFKYLFLINTHETRPGNLIIKINVAGKELVT